MRAAFLDAVRYRRAAADGGFIGNLDMPHRAHAAADDAITADFHAARNPRAGSNHRVFADLAVVRDLNQVVDFRAAPHAGVAHRAAVNRGIRADFHIVAQRYRARLRDFEPVFAGERQPEAVRTDDAARMDFHAIAQRAAVVHGNVWMQKAACTQRAAVFHHRVCQNAAAFAQHRVFTDIHMRADFAACRHNGGRLNHGGGVHA